VADHTRNSDPPTSFEAGEKVDRHTIRRRVLALFHQRPRFTDEQLTCHYHATYGPIPESSARKRRCELTHDGLIRDSGQREELSTGRMGIVWELVDGKLF
jgi:hypothetical protein